MMIFLHLQVKNRDYFCNFVTEDFGSYIVRKRLPYTHGNHLEMQAMAELYNRQFEVYEYDISEFFDQQTFLETSVLFTN